MESKTARITDSKARARQERRLQQKRSWYAEVTRRFADRIIPIDLAVAERWAEVSVRFPSRRDADKAIAATAMAKSYGVATENLGDFRQAGLVVVNPFDPGSWPDDGPASF